jgi:hypothetical protein
MSGTLCPGRFAPAGDLCHTATKLEATAGAINRESRCRGEDRGQRHRNGLQSVALCAAKVRFGADDGRTPSPVSPVTRPSRTACAKKNHVSDR